MTTLTIRTDEKLKEEAKEVFESMGLNISTAINVFLKQAVLQKRFPIGIEAEKPSDYRHTYPKDFFNFFGSGKDDNLEVPEDMALKPEEMDL